MKTQCAIRCFSVCVSAIVGTTAIAQPCQDNAACDDNNPCTFDKCDGGACSNTAAVYGDIVGRPEGDLACEPDGDISIVDIIAVWEGFTGDIEATIPGCSMRNADISSPDGCGADGKVDLYDMFAVVDAFNGIYNCCYSCSSNAECDDGAYCNGTETCDTTCQPGWANSPCRNQQCDNEAESCVAGTAHITATVTTEGAWPESAVLIDLYLSDIVGLAGYQVGIEVTRTSGSGSLTCAHEQCARIDPTMPGYVFVNGGTIGFGDDGSARILGVYTRYWESIDIGSTPGYLGTFSLTVSQDATPGATFEVSIRTDQLLLSSYRNSMPYDVGSPLVVTVPYPDCDGDGLTDICALDCNARDGACNVSGCGTRIDCNENAIPDGCDVDNRTSEDVNDNEIPDECEVPVHPGCETKLIAAAYPGKTFGKPVSLGGDYLAVGFSGYHDDDGKNGAAAVYRREGDGWVHEAMLFGSDVGEIDRFGWGVAVSGDYVVAGAPLQYPGSGYDNAGAAYVFHRDSGVWTEQAKLIPNDRAAEQYFGDHIAISGDCVVFGIPGDSDVGALAGAAYVFRRDGTNWVQEAKLTATDAADGDKFGRAVAVAGDYLAVGAHGVDTACPNDADCNSGSVYIFRNTEMGWIQETKLSASDASEGSVFGWSIAMSDAYLVVGSRGDDELGNDAGSAYVFKRTGSSWVQEAKLTANDAAEDDRFGFSVSVSGDSVAVSADNNETGLGRAYLFRRDGETWVQHNSFVPSDLSAGDHFGWSVGVGSGEVVVGAYREGYPSRDHVGRRSSGSVYIFDPSMDYDRLGGDVNRDGVRDVFDILDVLDGFMGNFENRTLADVDIRTSNGECGPDGLIGLQDILGVLDGFMGGG